MKSFGWVGNNWLLFTYPVIGNLVANIRFRWYYLGEFVSVEYWGIAKWAEKLPVIIDNRSDNTVLEALKTVV